MTSFEYEGKTYELNMTRAGVRQAESQGLSASEIADKPFSAVYLLFFASLFSKYKVNPSKSNLMLDHLLDSGEAKFEDMIETLTEAYTNLFGLGESE